MDILAGSLELVGCWILGNRNRVGFILNLLGCTIWIYVAINKEIYGLLIVVVPAIIINIRNFRKWEQ